MGASQIYILVSVVTLFVIALLFFLNRKKKTKKLSNLTVSSFIFVISGLIFGDNRLVSYSLIGTGAVIAVFDLILNKRKKK
jgi:hypothetical protein